MTLYEWAKRWGITKECFSELLSTVAPALQAAPDQSESRVQSIVRLEAARIGVHLFRNNVGAGYIVDPKKLCPECSKLKQFIRWGLANDSSRVNKDVKSADLIGWRAIAITQQHVGCVLAQFVSREIKESDWRWTGTPREQAQFEWATLVNTYGGDAKFATGEGSFT